MEIGYKSDHVHFLIQRVPTTQMYDENGFLVWDCTLDIYGRAKLKFGSKTDCPFRWQGQYEDIELEGLYYNRFRYYDSNSGLYISKDPIGLKGGFSLYSYVKDANIGIDPFGLFNTFEEFKLAYKDVFTDSNHMFWNKPKSLDLDAREGWK